MEDNGNIELIIEPKMEGNGNIDLIKEQCRYLEYRISDLQSSIARADTKVSILLAAIGVFIKIAIDAFTNTCSCSWKWWLIFALFFIATVSSAIAVIIGLKILWKRKKASIDDMGFGNSYTDLRNKLSDQIGSLKEIFDEKYTHFNAALVFFAISVILTMAIVIIQ